MSRYAALGVVATALVANACGGTEITGPSSIGIGFTTGGAPRPTPAPPSPTPTPTPTLPSTFEFVNVDDLSLPSSLLPLWGLRGQNTVEIVKQMVFCNAGITVPGSTENGGLRSMRRVNGPISVVYDPQVFDDAKVAVFASGTRILGDQIPFPISLGTSPGAGARVDLVMNPAMTSQGQWFGSFVAGVFTGGRIEFREMATVKDFVFRHELGHVFGLCHHNERGLMSGLGTGNSTNPADHVFSLAERDNIAAMLALRPGTQYPGP